MGISAFAAVLSTDFTDCTDEGGIRFAFRTDSRFKVAGSEFFVDTKGLFATELTEDTEGEELGEIVSDEVTETGQESSTDSTDCVDCGCEHLATEDFSVINEQ